VLIGAAPGRTVAEVVEISRQQLVVYAAAALAVALIGARYLKQERDAPGAAPAPAVKVARGGGGTAAHVHVTGAVRRPGVYRLPPWARLDAAIRRAGGVAARADLQGVNLAAKVSDGQQVVVPERVAGGAGSATSGPAAAVAAADVPISLNTATAEQLDQLEGVGPATAQKILDWRQEHVGFRAVEDLQQISGIGPKRFAALKEKVRM
jgi:competence protein ComEA